MDERLLEYLSDMVLEKEKIKPILKNIEKVKKLSQEEKEPALFSIYVQLEKFITTHKPPVVTEDYTVDSLRKEIKDTFGVKGFNPRLGALLGISGVERIIFSESILDELIKNLTTVVKVSRVQSVIDETTRGQIISDIKIGKDGKIDFSTSERKIFAVSRPQFRLISINYRNLINALYWRLRDELGEEKSGKLLRDIYHSLKEKYGYLPESKLIVTVMPDEFLTDERRLEVLTNCYTEIVNGFVEELTRGGITSIKKDVSRVLTSVLENVKITSSGSFDFSQLPETLAATKGNREQILVDSFSKLVSTIYKSAKEELGEDTTGKILEDSYKEAMERYGSLPITTQVLRVVPEGVLETEKMEAKAKEEFEKGVKRMDMLRGEFATVAAHELRGPLVPIITYTELLIRDKKSPPTQNQKKKLELILMSAHREKELVDDVMDMTKLESGAMRFDMQEINIKDVIEKAVESQKAAAETKNIYLKAKVPKGLPTINADPKRITQVIVNFVRNSNRFTDKGGITVAAQRDGDRLVVDVQDTGVGISDEDLAKLFRKFSQVGDRKEGGTGLGLAISKSIVEAHGGNVWVKSKLGKGTTFSFSLPTRKSEKGVK